MYPAGDLPGAEERLRDFLIYRFGGPQRYIEQRGHPRLRMRHAPFAVNQAARDRWIQLMNNALAESALPADADALLRQFFASVATFMSNRQSCCGAGTLACSRLSRRLLHSDHPAARAARTVNPHPPNQPRSISNARSTSRTSRS